MTGLVSNFACVLALAAVAATACSGVLPAPDSADAAWAAARWPTANQGQLAQGRLLYRQRCAGCHMLYPPAEQTPAQWPGVVARMAPHGPLAPNETEAVVKYLVTVSRPERHADRRPASRRPD